MKAARGAKRVCQSCGSKFYDLNRDPITCPICNAVFMDHDAKPKAVLVGNTEDDEDDEVLTPAKGAVEVVSLEEVAADENEDIPDLEDSDLAVDEEEEDLGGNDEDFIAVEDDDEDDDVTGIVGGSREDNEEA